MRTDAAGRITVPGTDGRTTVGGEDEDGRRYTLTVKVEDYESGRPIPDALVSIGRTGRISVTLPDGEDMDEQNRITVTVTDHKRVPQKGLTVAVRSDLGRTEEEATDEYGKATVPPIAEKIEEERHSAYIFGYPDGSFGPGAHMTRSEAAVFARILAAKKGDKFISSASAGFTDVPANAWYSGYVNYLAGCDVIFGREGNAFAPDEPVTRTEFTAMAVRFFAVYGGGNGEIMDQFTEFSDVTDGYWAARYIEDAAKHGWVLGYGDGSFGPDKGITRAEMVTLVNRLLGRSADMDFIRANIRALVTFPDVTESDWYYGAVMEAANNHTAKMDDVEIWSR